MRSGRQRAIDDGRYARSHRGTGAAVWLVAAAAFATAIGGQAMTGHLGGDLLFASTFACGPKAWRWLEHLPWILWSLGPTVTATVLCLWLVRYQATRARRVAFIGTVVVLACVTPSIAFLAAFRSPYVYWLLPYPNKCTSVCPQDCR